MVQNFFDFEGSKVPIVVINKNGRLVSQNNSSKELFFKICNKKDYCFFDKYINKTEHSFYNQIISNEEIDFFDTVFNIENRNHTYRILILRNKKNYTLKFFDVTDLYNKIDQENKKNEHLEKSNRNKTEFIYNLNHEIRNSLNGIMGISELLKGTELSLEQDDYLKILESTTKNILGFVNDILDISKIEDGKEKLKTVEFDIKEMIQDIVLTFKSDTEKKGNKILFDFEVDKNYKVFSDELKLKQVLINILNNANKFTKKGTITVSIKIVKETKNTNLYEITIEDSGIGIKDNNLQKIFQRSFYEKDEKENKNFGLGLHIVKKLINIIGGDLKVYSTLNIGTKIVISLPLQKSETQNKENECNNKINILRLLIVEDNLINQRVVKRLLEIQGHSVDVVSSGKEAVEKVEENNYNIVFMDINMPYFDGIETTKAIREQGKDVYIIALTAYAYEYDKKECIKHGMNDFIIKPIDSKLLTNVIEKYINEKLA